MIAIGIDPGKTTGIAVAFDGVLVGLYDGDFWDAVDAFNRYESAAIIVELPTTKHVWHFAKTQKKAVHQSMGVDVGGVIREAELLVVWAKRNGRKVIAQKPQGKIDAERFKRITGWKGRTNQHQRDAAMLVHGVDILELK